jgi:hypothetical protein
MFVYDLIAVFLAVILTLYIAMIATSYILKSIKRRGQRYNK